MSIKADYHLHPLAHTYKNIEQNTLRQVELTPEDKERVRDVVDWCVLERKLDAFAISDHDMLQSSLYAKEYADSKYYVTCIYGAELEVRVAGFPPAKDWVHILAYHIATLPDYTKSTPLDSLIALLRQQNATVVMAHPVMYPQIFEKYAGLIDGYENLSGTTPRFDGGPRNPMLRKFQNSDFHYKGWFPPQNQYGIWSCEEYMVQ